MATAPKSVKKAAPKATGTFSAEERAAMQDAAKEAKRGKDFDGEAEVLAKIAEMTGSDKAIAERIHAIVKEAAPGLKPKTWYGMPAYSNAAGKSVCFFQSAAKFKSRYAMLGFSDQAALDDGNIWPAYYAIKELTAADEKKIAALIRQAAG